MKMEQIKFRYPTAGALIDRAIGDSRTAAYVATMLSWKTLEAIDTGAVDEAGAVALIEMRVRMLARFVADGRHLGMPDA